MGAPLWRFVILDICKMIALGNPVPLSFSLANMTLFDPHHSRTATLYPPKRATVEPSVAVSMGIITQIYLTIFETCWFTTNHTFWYLISWQFTTSFVVNWGLRYCLPRARYALGLPNGYAGQLTPGRCHTSLWRDDQATLPASEPLVKPRK